MVSPSWKPNLNAKPFLPSSSAYVLRLPCCYSPVKIRKRGIMGRLLQGLLITVLCVTVVFNVIFIMDNSKRLRTVSKEVPDDEEANNNGIILERNQVINKQGINRQGSKTGRDIKIEVRSGKELVYVSIDGLKVYENSVTDDNARGIHVIVLNQHTGAVMATRVFDTYMEKEDQNMILFLNILQEGRIVIFTLKDEGSMSLKRPGRNSIKMFGSKFIDNLGWRDTWALISAKRNIWYSESLQKNSDIHKWAAPVIIQVTVNLGPEKEKCKWGEDEVAKRRQEFCEKFEGYGTVCNCKNPAPIVLHGGSLPNNKVANLPVAVIASSRPHYLYRMLRRMLSVPGSDAKMTTVYIDGFFDEPAAVAKLFNVRAVQHTPICSKNCRISQHYKRSLVDSFSSYPDAKYLIIIEEDLDVSKDFFDYFSQMMPLLESDSSLYCVSAWNDQGYDHSCNDPALLYRIETMPGLGWVLKRSLFKDELEAKWPGTDKFWDWDMWMRLDDNKKGRECIIPDISRTYHFGAKGLNMNSYFQDSYFSKHALNTATNIKFDIEKVRKENYEKEIHQLIQKAELLDHTKNPCNHKDFVPNTEGKTYVAYIRQDHFADWQTWTNFAKCFKLWDLDVRGYHKCMWRFWIKKNHIILVGVPASPYAKYKPDNVKPIFIPKKEKENEGKQR